MEEREGGDGAKVPTRFPHGLGTQAVNHHFEIVDKGVEYGWTLKNSLRAS